MTYLKHMNLHWTYLNLHWTYVFWKSHFLMNGSGWLKFSAEIHSSLNCNMLIAILWLKLAYVICKGSDKRVACQSEVSGWFAVVAQLWRHRGQASHGFASSEWQSEFGSGRGNFAIAGRANLVWTKSKRVKDAYWHPRRLPADIKTTFSSNLYNNHCNDKPRIKICKWI